MTKAELAHVLGCTARTIANYETGARTPDGDVIEHLARTLSFAPTYFQRGEPQGIEADAVSFRSYSRMSAQTRNACLGLAAMGLEMAGWLEDHFNLPAVDLPVDSIQGMDAELAAATLRDLWEIDSGPIRNMLALLESKGIRIFSLEGRHAHVDAFSFWHCGKPFIFLDVGGSSERARFNLAHELAHLMLHRDGYENRKFAEQEADAFASALLMPEADVKPRIPQKPTLRNMTRLKKRWGVSLVALIFRAHKLQTLTEWQYRWLMKEASRLGYRKEEPDSIPRERSPVLIKIAGALRANNVPMSKIAEDLGWCVQDVHNLFLGHALVPLPSQNNNASPRYTGNERPDLRIIEGGLAAPLSE